MLADVRGGYFACVYRIVASNGVVYSSMYWTKKNRRELVERSSGGAFVSLEGGLKGGSAWILLQLKSSSVMPLHPFLPTPAFPSNVGVLWS